MKQALIICLTILLAALCLAQTAPTIMWQKSLGGSDWDYARSIQQTSDGGFIVAGYSNSNDGDVTGNHGGWDYWVVKLNPSGDIEWQKSLGGSNDDVALSIQQTSDGGFIVAGYSNSNDGDVTGHHGTPGDYPDYWVVKLNSSGNIEWQKSLGGSITDVAYSIQQTSDGGFIVAGYSYSNDGDVTGHHGGIDYWVVKLNLSGDIEWQKSLGGSYYDYAYSIQQTSDGGFIVAGVSSSNDGDVTGNHGGYDYWVVKLNSSGGLEWQKSLGGSSDDGAYSIQQTSDGGFIVAGASYSNNGDVTGNHGWYDYWVVKLNPSGDIVWQKSLGGSDDDWAWSIQQTADGGFIVAGYSYSNDGDVTGHHGTPGDYADYWVVKLNPSGGLEWQKSLGGSEDDRAFPIQQTSDGGFIVAGRSGSNDGDVTGNHGGGDYWVVKLSPDTYVEETHAIPDEFSLTASPNPFNSSVRIAVEQTFLSVQNGQTGMSDLPAEIEIFDVNGRLIKTLRPSATSLEKGGQEDAPLHKGGQGGSYIWQPDETLGSGVYLVRASIGNSCAETKIVFVK